MEQLKINEEVEFVEAELVVDGDRKNTNEVSTASTGEIMDAMSEDEAKQLTQDIQSTTTALYVLLKRAHDNKAWLALGYKSWTEYIEKEFDFSRARSYQLINQANVIEEINGASGVPLYLTEREARDIKKRLPQITKKIEEDVKGSGLSDDEAKKKVKQIIEEETKEDIDNAAGYKGGGGGNFGEDDGWDNPNVVAEEDMEEYNPENKKKKSGGYQLSDDDKFYYENLCVTLKIFESLPNASLLGEKLSKSDIDKKELKKMAESSSAWITRLLDELE